MSEFRADRLITVRVVRPIRQVVARDRLRIPILMYHSVSELDESRRRPYYRIGTSPRMFSQQMAFLHSRGYKCIGLETAAELLERKTEAPKRSVVLTFDDGYCDFHREALPVLDRFGFSATVFLPTAFISERGSTFNGLPCLTWPEIRELRKGGIEFGSHTVSHPELEHLSSEGVRCELLRSRQTIEDKIGCLVQSFCYPYAFPGANRPFVRILRGLLKETGYRYGVCTSIGTAGCKHNRLHLPRLPINSSDDLTLFQAKLDGNYDWLYPAQHLVKRIKRLVYVTLAPTSPSRVSIDF